MSGNPHRLAGCLSLRCPNTVFPSSRAVMLPFGDSCLLLISLQLAKRPETLASTISSIFEYFSSESFFKALCCNGQTRTHLAGISWNGPLNHSGGDFLECVQSSLTAQQPGAWLWEEYTSPASQCQAAEGTPGLCVLGSTLGC